MSTVLKPRMSEKTYAQSSDGVFVFEVDSSLNKHQVAELVAKSYEVTIESVRIANQKGKTKRLYRNRRFETGIRSDTKKAYVTLKKGNSIPIFAAVEEAEEKAEEVEKKTTKKTAKAAAKPEAVKNRPETKQRRGLRGVLSRQPRQTQNRGGEK